MDKPKISKKNEENYRIAKTLRSQGWSYYAIAGYVGVKHSTVACWFSAKARKKRKEQQAAHIAATPWSRKSPERKLPPANFRNISRAKIEQAKREIAVRMAAAANDCRDKTAQICGDPLPARSALNQCKSAGYKRKTPPIVPTKAEIRDDGIIQGPKHKYSWL